MMRHAMCRGMCARRRRPGSGRPLRPLLRPLLLALLGMGALGRAVTAGGELEACGGAGQARAPWVWWPDAGRPALGLQQCAYQENAAGGGEGREGGDAASLAVLEDSRVRLTRQMWPESAGTGDAEHVAVRTRASASAGGARGRKSLVAICVGGRARRIVEHTVRRFAEQFPARFDVWLFAYDDEAGVEMDGAHWQSLPNVKFVHSQQVAAHIGKKRGKWNILSRFITPEIVERLHYEYIFAPDDDVLFPEDTFDPIRYLDMIRRLDLPVTQPRIVRGEHCGGNRCAYQSGQVLHGALVEIMVPVLSASAWTCAHPLMDVAAPIPIAGESSTGTGTGTGWGLDLTAFVCCAQQSRGRPLRARDGVPPPVFVLDIFTVQHLNGKSLQLHEDTRESAQTRVLALRELDRRVQLAHNGVCRERNISFPLPLQRLALLRKPIPRLCLCSMN